MNGNKCKDCHFFKDENPFEVMSNCKFYPCTNIGVDGWDYWNEVQDEPEHCSAWVKKGEYKPSGIWADMAQLLENLEERIEQDVKAETCYECTGYGDDYYADEDGNLVSSCDTCWVNADEDNE